MIRKLKAGVIRLYYRWINYWAWRGRYHLVDWEELEIPGQDRSIAARHYVTGTGADRPLIVYFHGGGWVVGDLKTHHPFCCELSGGSSCTVVAVDYSLAPERPFPAGPEDCLAAVKWIAENLESLGSCNGRLVLAGDSAGGNLALATCLDLDAKTRELVAGVCAVYPSVDHYKSDYPSHVEHATGQVLTTDLVTWFWDTYLGQLDPESAEATRAFPLRSDKLASLPSTLLVTAEFDPLRDEGQALGNELQKQGVPLVFRHFDNAAHGFACSQGRTEDFEYFIKSVRAWVRALA